MKTLHMTKVVLVCVRNEKLSVKICPNLIVGDLHEDLVNIHNCKFIVAPKVLERKSSRALLAPTTGTAKASITKFLWIKKEGRRCQIESRNGGDQSSWMKKGSLQCHRRCSSHVPYPNGQWWSRRRANTSCHSHIFNGWLVVVAPGTWGGRAVVKWRLATGVLEWKRATGRVGRRASETEATSSKKKSSY